MTVAERGSATALDRLRRHADHSSAFLAFNRDVEHFMARGCDGLVAYRPAGRRHAIQLCGPFSEPDDRAATLDEFLAWVGGEGRRLTAVQLRAEDVSAYVERGFQVNQLGSSYGIELDRFGLRGTRFMRVRNKISRARRAGVTVTELADEGRSPELDEIDAAWLRSKGRHVHELAFLVGERGGRGAPLRRIFMAVQRGRPLGYITYSPVFGARPGWLYDLTRRRADAPPGTIELLFVTALERIRDEGVAWLHLGLTPFAGLEERHAPGDAESRAMARVFKLLRERGEAVYPSASQEAFKLKWGPTLVEPEYIAFQGGASAGAFVGLLRLAKVLPW